MYYRRSAAAFPIPAVIQGSATLQASASLYAPLPSVVADTLPPSVIGYNNPPTVVEQGNYEYLVIDSWTVTPQAGDTIIVIAVVEDFNNPDTSGAYIGYPTGYTQLAMLGDTVFVPDFANGTGSMKVWKRTATGTSKDNFATVGKGGNGSNMTASAIVIPTVIQ